MFAGNMVTLLFLELRQALLERSCQVASLSIGLILNGLPYNYKLGQSDFFII